jgi:para-aminobenzoate synthetase/4-amino-4-deoxychorismate lyase
MPIPDNLSPDEIFVLLDDAGPGARDARLYRQPLELVIARRANEVLPALARIDALRRAGRHLAGYLAYEAGLAMEPHLAPLAAARSGADGPLVWFGAFAGYEAIAAHEVPQWLAAQSGAQPASVGPLEPQISIGGYAHAFAALREAIVAGEIYQANFTFPLAGSWHGDPLAIYAALREASASGHGGVVHDGGHWLLSLSPELFFTLAGAEATAKPMKGTRPRGATRAADRAQAEALAASGKDRAENLMIVDLMRNDLARVTQPGSVRVEQAFAVETYPTLHQMVTTIRARLAAAHGAADLLRALFPCGSVTGAPKIRAIQLLQGHERDPRGAYCGAIGRFDPASSGANAGQDAVHHAGEAVFNVAIRTLRLTPDERSARSGGRQGGGRAVMGVGSALVADSECLPEWRECLVKGGFVRQPSNERAANERAAIERVASGPVQPAAARFDLIETMRFSPDGGIPLLDHHIARLTTSARELAFACDRHALRNAIQALCFEAEAPAKLRLLLARSGAYSLEITELPQTLPNPAPCIVLPLPVDSGDWRLRHKTSDRGFYEAGSRVALESGAGEALFIRDDGRMTEGCFTSIFIERDGILLTPPAHLGLLPGVLRCSLIEAGRAREAELRLEDLGAGFLIGNALRGLMPACLEIL